MKKFHETKTLFSFRDYGVQINCSNFSCGKKGKLPIKTEIRPSSNDNLAESQYMTSHLNCGCKHA